MMPLPDKSTNVAFLCLGGNMGDRLAHLRKAVTQIRGLCGKITACSRIYETQAWGLTGSPDYYNQCLKLETGLSAPALLDELLAIERSLGRERTGDRNAPRLIDIDILLYDQVVIHEEHCQIPHPRMQLRQFVLKPLNEIAAGVVHPVFHKTITQLLEECTDTTAAVPLPGHVHLH